jgi:CDP-diacylglycerol---glycerol-3-phosphate 3-phosphatidyltransferase
MSVVTKPSESRVIFNIPNQLTTARLVLSIILFVLIECQYFLASTVLFVVAAGTDWLDGYYARKYQMVTTLGRILDPFVDKVIVCGTFIYLLTLPTSRVFAWMVVVIVGRELLVTALRSFLEQEGADFSASMSGKLKMVLQCVAAAVSLFHVYYVGTQPDHAPALRWLLDGILWAAVIATVVSGAIYVRAAIVLLRANRKQAA